MPELPEVEVLVRHLAPLLKNRIIRRVEVRRAKTIAPHSPSEFASALRQAKFQRVNRRGKYLVFDLQAPGGKQAIQLIGHLGMTGRMYLLAADAPLARHVAAVFHLNRHKLIFEDTRYFGRLTLDGNVLDRLGPEPLGPSFTPAALATSLKRSAQAIKVRLLDQSIVSGVGNIYASEALFRARIHPQTPARNLSQLAIRRLWQAIRAILRAAIALGSTVPLDWTGTGGKDGLFYYGRAADAPDFYEERLRVYDQAGKPCIRCKARIRRIIQAARSTYYCPRCQRLAR